MRVFIDFFQYGGHGVFYPGIPETEYPKTLGSEKPGADVVVFCLIVFSVMQTIQLNNQFLRATDKIDYVLAYHVLAMKFISGELAVAQCLLQTLFR